MNLFRLVNYKLEVDPAALTLKPFAVLWDRDTSKDKVTCIAELSVVYHMSDRKSDFSAIIDYEDKIRAVRGYVKGLPPGWEPDAEVNSAIEFYKQRSKTVLSEIYEGTLIGVSKLDKFLRNINLSETDKSGKPKYNAKQINDTIKSMASTWKEVQSLEKMLKEEEATKNDLRGGRKKGVYAD
jgi:hypothetical protein